MDRSKRTSFIEFITTMLKADEDAREQFLQLLPEYSASNGPVLLTFSTDALQALYLFEQWSLEDLPEEESAHDESEDTYVPSPQDQVAVMFIEWLREQVSEADPQIKIVAIYRDGQVTAAPPRWDPNEMYTINLSTPHPSDPTANWLDDVDMSVSH